VSSLREERPGEGRVRNPLTLLLMGLVRAYQLVVSPWYPQRCKYYPSCSAYAMTALRTHGVVKGLGLTGWRLLRCNPWSLGGVDHVPPRSGGRDHTVQLTPDRQRHALASAEVDRRPAEF
jgi:putative membrane protein insertion efficiency factor